jgi:selenide,water dikinase
LGHLLELSRGAGLTARLAMASIPLLPNVLQLAEDGYVTGASGRNWKGYGDEVVLDSAITLAQRALLTDPQTSGGLLVSCDPAAVDEVLALFRHEGFAQAAVIGEMVAGAARIDVTA